MVIVSNLWMLFLFFSSETAWLGSCFAGLCMIHSLLNYAGWFYAKCILWVKAVLNSVVGRDTNARNLSEDSLNLPSLFLLQSKQSLARKMLLWRTLLLGTALFVGGQFGFTGDLGLPLSWNTVFFQFRHCLFGVFLLWKLSLCKYKVSSGWKDLNVRFLAISWLCYIW